MESGNVAIWHSGSEKLDLRSWDAVVHNRQVPPEAWRFRVMIVTNRSALAPESPAIDVSEARWASDELAALIRHLGLDSPVSMVLRQTRRELASLIQSADSAAVVGPFRVAA